MEIPEQLKGPLRQQLDELNGIAAANWPDRTAEQSAMDTLQYIIKCGQSYYGLPSGLVVRRDMGQYILVDWRSGDAVEI